MEPDLFSETFWIHKKTGKRYFLIKVDVKHSETLELLVLYCDIEGNTWVRPHAMFFDGRFEKDPDQNLWDCMDPK